MSNAYRFAGAVAAPLLIAGCGMPIGVQIASFLADTVSVITTDKTLTDHGISSITKKDCALWRTIEDPIRAGKAAREGDAVKFDTEGAGQMLQTLSLMIDVERAECAVRADYDREMDAVRNGEGHRDAPGPRLPRRARNPGNRRANERQRRETVP